MRCLDRWCLITCIRSKICRVNTCQHLLVYTARISYLLSYLVLIAMKTIGLAHVDFLSQLPCQLSTFLSRHRPGFRVGVPCINPVGIRKESPLRHQKGTDVPFA